MKLLYTLKRETWEKNWFGYDYFGRVDTEIRCVTYYGLFDDGTWEPLYKYCPWEDTVIFQRIKGVRNATKERLYDILREVYQSGDYKSLQLLIKEES